MNYTLSINLEGFDKAEQILSKLSGGVKGIAETPKISFNKWLDAGSEADGEKTGKKFGTGLVSGWGKAILTGKNQINKFWDDAIKNGESARPAIKGLREVGGKDLAKVNALGDITQFDNVKQKIDWKKILTGVGLGFSNPYIGSRLLSDEFGKLSAGKEGGIAGGLFGKGGIAGFSEIFIAFKIFKFAVDNFKRIIDSALTKAFDIYTKSAQEGLNTKFYTQRTSLAEILGVNPASNDVFRFGSAVQYLSDKIKLSTDTLSKNSRPLAETSMGFKILKLDFEALGSELAIKAKPALDAFIIGIDDLVKMLIKSSDLIADTINRLQKSTGIYWIARIAGSLSGGGGLSGVKDNGKGAGSLAGNIPALMSTMKQLPASSWEHMGLATMGAGNSVPQLIKKSNEYLKTIAASVTMHGPGSSGQFGLSPTVANP